MLPMNAMAQKVVPGSESGSMKPLTGTGLSYVTLQPPSQPLSLVQDHRPSVYQTPPYISGNVEEPETEKLIPNGVEITKTETEQDVPAVTKQNESNRNNNLSPENPVQEQSCEIQPEQVLTSLMDFPLSTSLSTPAQNKVEEKKAPVNNGSKESDGKAINTPVHIKQSPHKPEDVQAKNEVPKAKPTNQSLKVPNDNAAATLTSTYKPDAKVTTSPKTTKRKSRELKDLKVSAAAADGASKPKRNRIQTQPYQSPLPEIALLVKSLNKTPSSKTADEKLIVFYKNEFLAVRNAEGSFYVCQAMQNIYKSSRRIRIRWLSQDKTNGEFYSPDFYDNIDFDCILTNLNLNKVDKHKFWLTRIELLRTENILKRAIDVEAGVSEKPRVTEEHPDGLDLSLYKDESQLKRRKGLHNEKPNQRKKSKRAASSTDDDADEEESDRNRKTPKTSRAKKRSVNKALAIAKSVAKGSSRAERALNRSTKSGNSLGNDIVTTAAVTTTATITTSVTTAPAVATTATVAATAAVSVTTTSTTTVNPTTNISAVADAKNNAESKKLDLKKNGKQQSNNSIRGVPRIKLPGSAQAIQQANKMAGRPKRVAATTGVLSSEEAPSPRKKPRGRA
ncbi:uncharacterized protein LOC126853452 [Cataglyphis hispanica]|uniref:uncharacterized protein LOC126853452 n=1 Tax=Cataglyphis hispanica TaxID=1086592 RepID=UPI00218021F7|nr:uncharacterized protein LOC126853452 [Cataglyphis hispanica]XP_050455187.1 uncharacterized protein LOC126853452 [Cataglyphis hispanica]